MKEKKRGCIFRLSSGGELFLVCGSHFDNNVEQPSGFSGNFISGSILLCIQTSRLAESIKI